MPYNQEAWAAFVEAAERDVLILPRGARETIIGTAKHLDAMRAELTTAIAHCEFFSGLYDKARAETRNATIELITALAALGAIDSLAETLIAEYDDDSDTPPAELIEIRARARPFTR